MSRTLISTFCPFDTTATTRMSTSHSKSSTCFFDSHNQSSADWEESILYTRCRSRTQWDGVTVIVVYSCSPLRCSSTYGDHDQFEQKILNHPGRGEYETSQTTARKYSWAVSRFCPPWFSIFHKSLIATLALSNFFCINTYLICRLGTLLSSV